MNLFKRQRSDSIDSVASSSASKRAGGSSPAALQLSIMDINDASPSPSSSSSTEPLARSDGEGQANAAVQPRQTPPDPAVQLETVLPLVKRELQEGDTWFVVDRKWYRRWQAACGGAQDGKDAQMLDISAGDVGPIDNSALADQNTGKLTATVVEGDNAVFLPGQAYHLLEAWYGTTGAPIKRNVVKATDGLLLDLYPPLVIVSRVVQANSMNAPAEPKNIQTSSGWTIAHLKDVIAEAFGVPKSSTSRIWHLNEPPSSGNISANNLGSGAELEAAADSDIVRTSSIKDGDDLAYEQANDDGSWLVNESSTSEPKQIKLFGGQSFLDKQEGLQKRKGLLTQPAPAPLFGLGPKAADLRVTRSQTGGSGSKHGLVGLTNLGNTCFMNSALQCLSNTPALQEYFQSGFYKNELNPDNPLGMHGEVAKAFGMLIERIWSGSNSVVTPREFKQTLSKFAPAFSGWQQHDSQELIAFLLDGLHEDLNRIKKKPYDEIPDWNGGGDKEELELATISWDLYKRRNDSVIVDLFQGQYRSRLVCPECSKVAIKFDPFMYLSLAIPQNRKWTGDVYLVPLNPKIAQKKVTLELPYNATIRKLKQTVAELTGYEDKKLFALEEWAHRFYKVWSDQEIVGEIGNKDVLILYELPYECERPRYRPPKAKTPEDEGKIMVSVLHTRSSAQSTYGNRDKLFGEPFLLALTAEEASDLHTIEQKVCERLHSWSGVGDSVWARTPPTREASAGLEDPKSQPAVSTNKAVIPDDEEDQDVHMASVAAPEAPVDMLEASTQRYTSSIRLTVSKNPFASYNYQAFTSESHSDRITLQERQAALKANRNDQHQKPPTARMPGGFIPEEPDELYEEDKDKMAEDVVSGNDASETAIAEAVSVMPKPLLRTGEVMVVEWAPRYAVTCFGTDADKSRAEGTERFSQQERVFDPVVSDRRKFGGAKKEKQAVSVDDLLNEFVKEEKLSEDNTWYCPSCKKHQQAQKKFDLWKMPDVLVIHLKRFSNERAFRDKIDVLVDFPIDGLDLSDRVEGKKVAKRLSSVEGAASQIQIDGDESLVYDLFAVDNHFGGRMWKFSPQSHLADVQSTVGGGHYTAFAKNIQDGKWYNFDDSRVSPVSSPDDVRTSAAYLLFYRRRSDRPIGGKTHDILASRTVSPSLSASDPTDVPPAMSGHSFRDSLSSSHGNTISPYFSQRPQSRNSGSLDDDVEVDLGDTDTDEFVRISPASVNPSPTMSDDEVLPAA